MKFQQWEKLEGKLKHVSVGASGVWGVNSEGALYRMDGKHWTQVHPSGWLTVSSGGKYVWATRTDHTVRRGTGDEESWQVVPGRLMQIEASMGKNAWGVAGDHNIYRYNGINWQQSGGKLQQVTSGPSGVWGVAHDAHVYYRPYTYRDEATIGGNWQHISASPPMKWVASGEDLVLAVHRSGDLYYRAGITAANPAGTDWVRIQGIPLLKQVDVFYSVVMAVDTEDNIWYTLTED